MNIIDAHLDATLGAFKQTGQLDAARRELRSMMEDAYATHTDAGATAKEAAAAVIAEFGDLEELAPTLGLERAHDAATPPVPGAAAHPPVTLGEAERFAATVQQTRFHLAGAIAAFVAAPAPLTVLVVGSETLRISATTGIIVGLATLAAIAAAGALLLVRRSSRMSPYARIRSGAFRTNPHVTQWVDDLRLQHDRRRSAMLAVSLLLWIASPAPLVMAALSTPSPSQPLWIGASAATTLLIVALGLLLHIASTWARTVAGRLQQPSAIEVRARRNHG